MISSHYTFSDLTIGEVKTLIMTYAVSVFSGLILFGIPLSIAFALEWGVGSSVSEMEKEAWPNIVVWALFIFIFWWVIKHLPEVLTQTAQMFTDWSKAAAKVSCFKRAAWIIFMGGYIYSLVHYPFISLLLLWLILFPATNTYDEYKRILNNKIPQNTTQDLIR